MSKPRKVVINKQRKVHTYAELWHASDCVLNAGLKNPEGSSWQFLSSVVLMAFTFEAFLNHVGAATFECWEEELERLRPWGKLQLLCEELKVSFPAGPGARPLQTIKELMKFRNTMAHGKTAELKQKPIMRTTENYASVYREELLAEWEHLVKTSDFAVRVREDVRAVLEHVHECRQDEKERLFSFGQGFDSAIVEEH
jgi:hypothetical protein